MNISVSDSISISESSLYGNPYEVSVSEAISVTDAKYGWLSNLGVSVVVGAYQIAVFDPLYVIDNKLGENNLFGSVSSTLRNDSVQAYAQEFVAQDSQIQSIVMPLWQFSGPPAGDVTVSISTSYSGGDLATKTIVASSLGTSILPNTTITFDSPVSVTQGSSYFLRVSYPYGSASGSVVTARIRQLYTINTSFSDTNPITGSQRLYAYTPSAGTFVWGESSSENTPYKMAYSIVYNSSAGASLVWYASVSDSIAITESSVGQVGKDYAVDDTATITESVSAEVSISTLVYDTVTIEDIITSQASRNVFDDLVVAEEVSVLVPQYFVSVFDTCSIAESTVGTTIADDTVTDDISVLEAVSVENIYGVHVGEDISIDESVTSPQFFYYISAAETLSISESVLTDSVRFSPQIPLDRPYGFGSGQISGLGYDAIGYITFGDIT